MGSYFSGSETICSHGKKLLQLNETIMKMVASSYGLEKHSDSLTESSFYMVRLIKYNSPNSSESTTGLRAHKDKGFISVLCSNEIQGLQLQNRDGKWMDFEQSPSKVIVLVGEALTVNFNFSFTYILYGHESSISKWYLSHARWILNSSN